MNKRIYYQGLPNTNYGVWDNLKEDWFSGICEETPMLAIARLHQAIGAQAEVQGRYEPRERGKRSR